MAIAQGIGIPVGICANDISANAAIVNLATEQLMMDPMAPDEGWYGGWIRMLFNVQAVNHTAYIVTPANIARVILLAVCQTPVNIRNGFYEDLQFSIGPQPRPCQTNKNCTPSTMQAFERDSVVTLSDFAGSPQLLRVFSSDPADLGRRIVFQGPDQNGVDVLSVDTQTQAAILGETVFITQPFASTLHQFSGLTGILKDPTLGFIQVFMVDPTTGNQTLLTTMGPNETTAQYRRYLINGIPNGCCSLPNAPMQVTADCRLDYVPVVSPSDYLSIPNLPALHEQVQAIRFSRMDSPAAAQNEAKHHLRALGLLNGQLDLYEGKVNTSIRIPIFGSDRMRLQPR